MPLAAQAAAVNINVAGDWPVSGTISLNDGDVLTIAAAAGSPANATVIQLAPNANVTINGSGAMITNLRLADGADTAAHNVSINNLHITAATNATGYSLRMGVLVLTGDNEIAGNGTGYGLNAGGVAGSGALTITSTTGGTLQASGGSGAGIYVQGTLNIAGNADVTAASSTGWGIGMDYPALNVAAGARLTALDGMSYASDNLTITCDGTIIVERSISAGNWSLAITGSGTLTATGLGSNRGITVASLTVNGTTVNATGGPIGGTGLRTLGATNTVLTGGATLNLTGGYGGAAFDGPGFTLDAGSTVMLANNSASAEQHPFTMAAGTPAGDEWLLAGSAALEAPSTATSSPATISVEAGMSGTIKLGPAGGGGGVTPTTTSTTAVPTLGEWALMLLALAMLGMTGAGLKRRG